MNKNLKDLVIIGSGPAGLSAAIYAQRAMLDQIVIEKEMFSGGQIINTDRIDNYLGLYGENGYDLAVKFREHADALEVPFVEGKVESIEDKCEYKEIHLEDGATVDAKAQDGFELSYLISVRLIILYYSSVTSIVSETSNVSFPSVSSETAKTSSSSETDKTSSSSET